MIRITIELLPKGDESRKRHLGTMTIANDATGYSTVGNYRVWLSRRGQPDRQWKVGRVVGFPRKKLGPYDLLYWALMQTVAERTRKFVRKAIGLGASKPARVRATR